MHGAHLLVEGKKMSKSLGNFYTLRDLLAKGFTGREIRYLLLTAHYREQFNFTLEGLQGARAALSRLDSCAVRLREASQQAAAAPDPSLVESFTAALDQDMNISAAWGAIFEAVARWNKLLSASELGAADAAAAVGAWQRLDTVLGLGIGRADPAGESGVPAELSDLLAQRQAARQAKDFKRADSIRDELKAKGWVIEDTAKGARLKRL